MKRTITNILSLLVVILIASNSNAQLSNGGQPASFSILAKAAPTTIPIETMATVDAAALFSEDIEEEKQGVPQRFGYPFEVNYDLTNSGVWETTPDGTRIWRLTLECPEAFSVNLIYDEFELPEGVNYFIYNADRSMLMGAFTSRNNKAHNLFATAPIKGDKCILELNVPPNISYPGRLSVSTIVHGYRDIFKSADAFGSSGSCNNNVECAVGDPWRSEINSVAMVILGSGTRWCSGAMVNNVREDLTPYFLTADHCLSSPENWIIMFNYQSPNCTPNTDGPTYMTLHGTTLRAFSSFSDFALVELSEPVPDSFDVFYSGWSNEDVAASNSTGIHHPAGDVKKISFNNNSLTSTSYYSTSSGNNSHWRVDNWEDGTTEGGSSGSPIYNQDHLIVGQLHGGDASCNEITADWYGKFSQSWSYGITPASRLRDWLDPDNTGATSLEGIDQSGLKFSADTTYGDVPLDVNFSATSITPVDIWDWDFGDGDSSDIQNPNHIYSTPGAFSVRIDIVTEGNERYREKTNYIVALADTIRTTDDTLTPGSNVEFVISARNNIPVNKFIIPFEFSGGINLGFDSISTVGCRTDYFTTVSYLHIDPNNKRGVAKIEASINGSQPELLPGEGAILKLHLTIPSDALPSLSNTVATDGYDSYLPLFSGSIFEYSPQIIEGSINTPDFCCFGIRGDINYDLEEFADISDLLFLIDYSFLSPPGPTPPCLDEADLNNDDQVDISDILYLVDYMFLTPSGPDPLPCF